MLLDMEQAILAVQPFIEDEAIFNRIAMQHQKKYVFLKGKLKKDYDQIINAMLVLKGLMLNRSLPSICSTPLKIWQTARLVRSLDLMLFYKSKMRGLLWYTMKSFPQKDDRS